MSSMQSSNSMSSLMCGGGRFDLNPYVSLLVSSASWSFKKKKALQRMRWIRDSVLFISCCRNVFLLASGMFLVEYSKSFTMYICIYVSMYVCMYVYIHIYIKN